MHIGDGSLVFILEFACLGSRKRLAVELAVLIDRQLVELYEERGYHVGGQLFGYSLAELVRLDRLALHIVRDEINLTVAVLEVLDRRVKNAVGVLDDRFDLARLHALTVDLDHPVPAVEVDEAAVFVPSAYIARAQQLGIAVLGGKGVIDKGLCGLLWKIEIAVREISRKTDLTLVGGLTVIIEKISLHVSDRLSYRSVIIFFVDLEHHHRACGLGLTVGDLDGESLAVKIADALAAR